MKELHYSKDKHAPFPFPLGGMGTGVMGFSYEGKLCGFDFCPDYDFGNAFCTFSAEVYNESTLLSKKLLQSAENDSEHDEKFTDSGTYIHFPFIRKVYEKSGFIGRITETAFTPFIPHNETDSGIPCAFFDFEVENTSDEVLKYTVKGECGGFFKQYENSVGCTESGALYIDCRDTKKRGSIEGSICLATDSKSFSYSLSDGDGGFSVTADFSLNPHEKKSVRFILTWYFPVRQNSIKPYEKFSFETDEEYRERNVTRNYYAQYFESSTECANYCFEHYERLLSETRLFSDTLYSSTLPECMLESITQNLCFFRSSSISRLGDGDLYMRGTDGKLISGENAYALLYLYPLISKRSAEALTCNMGLYEGASDEAPILQALSVFLNLGDFESLIEAWISLTKHIDALLSKESGENDFLYAYALKCASFLSKVAKDIDREARCNEKLSAIPNVFTASGAESALLHADMTGFSGNFEFSRDSLFSKDTVFPIEKAAILTRRGFHEDACRVLEECDAHSSEGDAISAYALLHAAAGLEYNAYEKRIKILPERAFSGNDGTFRCFFSLGSCYGFIERGIDYIEINILHGKLTIRSVGVPTRPLMVLYGGRKWKYTDEGLCARLDSDLILTAEKKLTVIIDVGKQG